MTEQALHAYLHITQTSGRHHLRVQQSWYTDDLKARMARVGSPAKWMADIWSWDYPLTPAAVLELRKVASELQVNITWAPELSEYSAQLYKQDDYEEDVRKAIESAIGNKTPMPAYPTKDFDGTKPPMEHQQVAYHWSLRTSGLMLAWEPGLGKSRAGVDAIGGWYRENIIRPMSQVWIPQDPCWEKHAENGGHWGIEGGVLIICPKAMMRTWKVELEQWQNILGMEIVGGRKRKLNLIGTMAHAHIINYEVLNTVLFNRYDAVILDESHKCANNSGQTMNALQLAMQARRKMLLTGTPVSNSLESVFFQMLICDGGLALGSSKTRFLEQHFSTERNGPVVKATPREGSVEEIAGRMSRRTYFLKKKDVLDLPEKTHTPLYLPMSGDQERYFNLMKKETVAYIQDATVTIEEAASRMMKLLQICQGFVIADEGEIRHFNSTKLDQLIELLTNSYSQRKVIVWARFTYEIELICRALGELGINYCRFDGTVKSKRVRDAAVDQWNTDPTLQVFVGQVSMGVGITLHAATCSVPCADMIYFCLDYSYVNYIQSMDRIHRIGQKWPCSYVYLLTENGIDGRVYDSLLAKEETALEVHKQGKGYYIALLNGETVAMPSDS